MNQHLPRALRSDGGPRWTMSFLGHGDTRSAGPVASFNTINVSSISVKKAQFFGGSTPRGSWLWPENLESWMTGSVLKPCVGSWD